MDISRFVEQSLTQICEGIRQAKINTKNHWSIAPGSVSGELIRERMLVDFDIAVIVEKNENSSEFESSSGGGKISVVAVNIGADVKAENRNEKVTSNHSVTKVKFSVPVILNAHHRNDPNFEQEIGPECNS